MVGVAGRSKACITCKKRRVACDSARPNCSQCTRSNRFCEGYDSYPVFLNRTISGWERRQQLQETKPRSESLAASFTAGPMSQAVPAVLRDQSLVWHEQLVSQFLHLYGVRDVVSSREALPLAFLSLSTQVTNLNRLAQLAFRALAITRIARQTSDARLLTSGTQTYCQALSQLQRAVYNPNYMYSEETLIAVKALVIHEGYESTSNNLEAWNAHMSAVTRLIVLRQPHAGHSPLAQAIIEEHRYPAMIQSIAGRRRNPMGNPEWRAGQMGPTPFLDAQTLFDIGFDIGALTEEVDAIAAESDSATFCEKMGLSRSELEVIENKLGDWYEILEIQTPGAMFFNAPELADSSLEEPELELPLTFHSPHIAEQLTTYWAIRIISLLLRRKICGILNESSDQAYMIPPPAPENFRELAILITRSARYSFAGIFGQYLSLRFLFPLKMAIETFKSSVKLVIAALGVDHPATKEAVRYRDWCADYYTQLQTKQGISYARDLQKEESKWESDRR